MIADMAPPYLYPAHSLNFFGNDESLIDGDRLTIQGDIPDTETYQVPKSYRQPSE